MDNDENCDSNVSNLFVEMWNKFINSLHGIH
jgi:hypothetical protein